MKKTAHPVKALPDLRTLCAAALLVALSVVLGKYLQIPVGDSIRLSFENLPILLAGIFLGPLWGGVVGITADLIGCAVMSYAVNPIITLGAALVGVLSGVMARAVTPRDRVISVWGIYLTVAVAHIVGSMTVKSIGLAIYFSTPIEVLLWRVPVYLLIGALEGSILLLLTRNRLFMGELERLTTHRKKRGR